MAIGFVDELQGVSDCAASPSEGNPADKVLDLLNPVGRSFFVGGQGPVQGIVKLGLPALSASRLIPLVDLGFMDRVHYPS
jgi:hypothetical protein